MKAFNRMLNVMRLPTGPHTPWPNRAEKGVRLFKKILSALVDTASKYLNKTTLSKIYTRPVDALGSDGEKHTDNSE